MVTNSPRTAAALAALALTCTTACAEPSPPSDRTDTPAPAASSPAATPTSSATPSSSAPPPTATASTSLAPTPPPVAFDPRNKFFDPDEPLRTSPWFERRGRVMIGFGCTDAPWYDASPKCSGGAGFHHGIDVAVPCGTPLRSAVSGTVVGPGRGSGLGTAYGSKAFLIRDRAAGRDVIVGHAEKVLVAPGATVQPGEQIALAGANGAPDGCHLHLEVRPVGGSVSSAVDPAEQLRLDPS